MQGSTVLNLKWSFYKTFEGAFFKKNACYVLLNVWKNLFSSEHICADMSGRILTTIMSDYKNHHDTHSITVFLHQFAGHRMNRSIKIRRLIALMQRLVEGWVMKSRYFIRSLVLLHAIPSQDVFESLPHRRSGSRRQSGNIDRSVPVFLLTADLDDASGTMP